MTTRITRRPWETVHDEDGTHLGYVERTGGDLFGWFAYDLTWHCQGEAASAEAASRILTGAGA